MGQGRKGENQATYTVEGNNRGKTRITDHANPKGTGPKYKQSDERVSLYAVCTYGLGFDFYCYRRAPSC